MSLIRGNQPAITNLSPHNSNARYIIPNRREIVAQLALTIGNNGPGTRFGYQANNYGFISPDNIKGLIIDSLRINATDNRLILDLSSQQLPDTDELYISLLSGRGLKLTWRPTNMIYQADVSVTFVNDVQAALGQTVAVEVFK